MMTTRRYKLAIFEFDGTLIKGDSFKMFARHSLGTWRYLISLMKSLPKLIKWKLGGCSASEAKEHLFRNLYSGLSAKELDAYATTFADKIDSKIKPKVLEEFKRAKREGYTPVIVSASPAFWIRPWAERNDFEKVIATEAKIENGIFTGDFATPNCKGQEKIRRLREIYPDLIDIEICFWGDSKTDLPMMRLATRAWKVSRKGDMTPYVWSILQGKK